MKQTLMTIQDLKKHYITDKTKACPEAVKAVNGISFKIFQGDFIGIMGKSGCGKTTLLKLLGSLEKSTSGKIAYHGKALNDLKKDELSDLRRRAMGFVFQEFNLMDSLTIKENIILPMLLDRKPLDIMEEVLRKNVRLFGIESLLKKYPYEISGGEKQRVAICRAISNHPQLIFADEPTGNLDSASSQTVIESFEKMNRVMEKTIVLVTHDPYIASYCKKVIFLKDGKILKKVMRSGKQEDFFIEILKEIPLCQ